MFEITMTGSFYRTKEIEQLLKSSKTGEIDTAHEQIINAAERLTISDRLLPLLSSVGLS